jgi:aminoglycoside phosphotransferase (APT) family kinase protein
LSAVLTVLLMAAVSPGVSVAGPADGDLREYLAAYHRRTGREEIPDWEFFIAFSMFRLAAIVQGVYKRGLDGIASSDTAKTYGDQVRFLADNGWQLVSKKR